MAYIILRVASNFPTAYVRVASQTYVLQHIYEVKCWENSNLLHIVSKSYDMKYSIVTAQDVSRATII